MRQSCRLLVVEDEAIIQMLIEDIAELSGHDVTQVSTVAAALAALRDGAFDAAVADCMLPDGTCEPVAEALTDRGIPFAIISGLPQDEISNRFPGARFVAKPFRSDELEKAMVALCSARQRAEKASA